MRQIKAKIYIDKNEGKESEGRVCRESWRAIGLVFKWSGHRILEAGEGRENLLQSIKAATSASQRPLLNPSPPEPDTARP